MPQRGMLALTVVAAAVLLCHWAEVVVARPIELTPPRGVMPWMCLERCPGTNQSDILQQITYLAKHQNAIFAVAFERFNLGANGTLVIDGNLTKVAPLLRFTGFTRIAMISSWPYPKDFIDWMRQLFANPFPFINNLTQALIDEDIDGVNVDFEPTVGITAEDAANYATFLETLRLNLGQINKTVSVDVARWTALWNFTKISAAMTVGAPGVPWGAVATMNTYVHSDASFLQEALYASNNVDQSALVVGLEAYPDLTVANVTYRFKMLQGLGVSRVGLWRVPVPQLWWPIIHRFVNGTL